MDSELTDQQELFCREYVVDLNGTKAAERAKYSPKTATEQASRLLTNVNIQRRIQELIDKKSKRLELTADKVLRDIEEIKTRCMQGVPVLDREGNPTGEWKFEAHAALKATELQGKHLKLFTEKIEHSGKITFENKTDEELDARINEILTLGKIAP